MEESFGARLLKQMKEIGELAGVKTEEYAKISKKRLDVMSLDREVSKEKAALGERVFELGERGEVGNVFGDVTVQAIIERIRKLHAELKECEREMETIRQAGAERAGGVRERYREEGQPKAGSDGAPKAGI